MLQSLRVKNLAVVQEAELSFAAGLNVITGETGAGKSIITGALNLLLGARADKSLIRTGETTCTAEAVYSLSDPAAVDAVLDDAGLSPCEDGTLILRRSISTTGTGRIWINDAASTAQTLKRLGAFLIDMHGPHDHQSLLDQNFQRDLLDAYGQHEACCKKYGESYSELTIVTKAIDALQGDDEDLLQEIDLLTYQCQEIEAAQLDDLDEEALQQEHTTSANSHSVFEIAAEINEALSDGEQSAFSSASFSRARLQALSKILPDADAWCDEAESICIQIQELATSLSSRIQRIETDPERLQWLEDRMAMIHKLKRKYGNSIDDIRARGERARQRLTELESREERLKELTEQAATAETTLRKHAATLTKARRKAAQALAAEITTNLQDLGFKHGQFSVDVSAVDTPQRSGLDSVDFGFAPNPGEESRPLRLIASSGEISRVMLAIKSVLARHDRIPVLVFDEIDANVGGEIGNAVGQKMKAVAARHQVLCITHLPQVAVCGNHHLVVTKAVKDKRTQTDVHVVAAEAREEEVARMLGGRDLTQVTLQHAREMLASHA
jgi:DNA repair protein RecN (Recombination protein N)